MGIGSRIAAATGLALVFAAAWAVGAATHPPAVMPPPPAAAPLATGSLAETPLAETPLAEALQVPASERVALVDGYRVRLDGDLVAGVPSQVFATVTRDGMPVTDLEPHLGGFGHLVAVRTEDLTFLRVHPTAPLPARSARSGPGIAFTTDVPAPGTYRLSVEFRHAGAVHAATFTVVSRPVP